MGKIPRRAATARALRQIRRAVLSYLGEGLGSTAPPQTEILEPRQMLSASAVPSRKTYAKLDSNLQSAYLEYQQFNATQVAVKKSGGTALPDSAFTPTDSILHTYSGDVELQTFANAGYTNALALALKRLKGQDINVSGREVDALFPISKLGKLAALGGMRFAEAAAYEVNTGAALSQGDATIIGPLARQEYNVSGAGVKVGIISDSFNNNINAGITDKYANDVATGDLPANVQILSDNIPGTDEGRAMAQVIYDTAPGASFAFADGGTYATGNNSIASLVTDGAKVIVDDVTYENEPFFQDGSVAKEVEAAIAAGVTYVSAAGNFAENSYGSAWRSGNNYSAGAIANVSGATPFYGGTSFNFSTTGGVNDRQTFNLASGSNITLSFQWDQPYYSASGGTGCRNQVDAYVLNSAGQIVGGGSNYTIGADPIQLFKFTNTTASTGTYSLMLVSEAGTALPGYVKYIDFSGQATNWQFTASGTNASTVFGHANAAGVEAVGAASYNYSGTPTLEAYSSEGGTQIYFNSSGGRLSSPTSRQEPAIVGPDNVYTTFYGTKLGNNPYPTFSGTSASAAAVAGVAALIVQKNPSLTPAAIDTILSNTALTMQTPSPNYFTGYGYVQAIPALTQTVGNVTGTVFSDNNANGIQDSGETGVGGVTVYIDANNNGVLDAGEAYTTTNSAGQWELYNQPSGLVVVRTLPPAGYVSVTTSKTVTIAGANTSAGVNFGVFPDSYTSSANGSNWVLQLDSTKTSNFDVLLNSTLLYTAPVSLVPGLSFAFSGNNSSLTVNGVTPTTTPVPSGGVTAAGIGNSTNDVVTINGSSAADTTYINAGVTTFDSSEIGASNIGTVIINAGGGNDNFIVNNAQPSTEALVINGGIGNDTLSIYDPLPLNGTTTTFNAGSNTLDQNMLNVYAGVFTFAGNPAAQAANLTINLGNTVKTGYNSDGLLYVYTAYGNVNFSAGSLHSGINQRSIAALNVGYGSIATVMPPASHADRAVLVTGSVNISSGGFDVNNNAVNGGIVNLNANDMIITTGSLAAIQPLVATGYNNGAWNGAGGINSGAAATDTTYLTALGILQNNNGVSFNSFDGVTGIASAILIKYTYYGDADLSGVVDGSDYSRIDNGVLQSTTGWSNGDFNYDNVLNGSDYTLIDNAYNTQGPSLG